jgi:biopolymer transport protein ExbD
VRIKRPPKKKNRISLTPLIDVVFLLLVFFMLASTFWRYSSFELAAGKSGTEQTADLNNLVFLRLKGGSNIEVNGKEVLLDQLQSELIALAGDKKIKVIIKTMEGASTQDLVNVREKMNISAVREIVGVN